MTAGSAAKRQELQDRIVALGRLGFADFALLDDDALQAALGPVAPARLAPLLARHPPVLRRLLRACPDRLDRPAGRSGPTGRLGRALVRKHAFELLAAKLPALYETLPWFDWDLSAITRGRPLWRTRLLLAGDSATTVAARCRRSGVKLVEPRARLADYARRKLRLVGVKRWEVGPGPLGAAVRAGGFDLAVLVLPLPCGSGPDVPFSLLTGPALVLALRPAAEVGVRPPPGWTRTTVRTAAGSRPGWFLPGSDRT